MLAVVPVSVGLKKSNVPADPAADEDVIDAESRRLTLVNANSGEMLSTGLIGAGAMMGAGTCIWRGGKVYACREARSTIRTFTSVLVRLSCCTEVKSCQVMAGLPTHCCSMIPHALGPLPEGGRCSP